METVKEVLSGIVQNKPVTEILYGVQQTRLATEATLVRVNPIFDDLRGDSELHAQWRFCATLGKCAPQPALDLARMLRDMNGANSVPAETRDQLDELSREINALHGRIGQERANEQDYCLYLHFLESVGRHMENSPLVYRVELPADDDGVNGQVAGANTVLYDSWHLERIVTLLRLFMLHANPAESRRPKERIEQFQRCVDYLRELQSVCTEASPQGGTKRLYRRPLSSLSSGASGQSHQAQYTDARTFVELYLGGLAGIETRAHLCEAQRREEIYRDLVERQLGDSSDGVLAMGAIVEAYELTMQASERQNKANKLSHHARFMHHLWLCRANLVIAQSQANKEDHTSLSEALQRVEYITRLHRARPFDKRSFTLDQALLDQYNPLILTANQSFREWDQTLLKLGVRPAQCEFVIEKHVFSEKPSLYATAMARCANTLQGPLLLLGSLLSREGIITPTGNVTHQNNNNSTLMTHAMQELLRRATDRDSARLGALFMQAAWLEWTLQLSEQNEFIMDTQYVQLLQQELTKTRDALARYS